MNDIFEELIQTIERNAVDNVTTISDVKLFVKSWREEFKIYEDIYSQSRADICKETEEWRTCKSWEEDKRCLKNCKFHNYCKNDKYTNMDNTSKLKPISKNAESKNR